MNWEDLVAILNPDEPQMASPYERPLNWQQRRWNELGVYEDPSMWTWVEHPTHADWYNLGRVKHIANKAYEYGVDPYDLVGIGMSETQLGNLPKTGDNPLRVFLDAHEAAIKKLYNIQNMKLLNDDQYRDTLIDYGARLAQKAFSAYPQDRLSGFQAYSGRGSVPYGGHPGRFFGQRWGGGRSMWQMKPQGRRARDLSDIARTNPDIVRIIDELLLNY